MPQPPDRPLDFLQDIMSPSPTRLQIFTSCDWYVVVPVGKKLVSPLLLWEGCLTSFSTNVSDCLDSSRRSHPSLPFSVDRLRDCFEFPCLEVHRSPTNFPSQHTVLYQILRALRNEGVTLFSQCQPTVASGMLFFARNFSIV